MACSTWPSSSRARSSPPPRAAAWCASSPSSRRVRAIAPGLAASLLTIGLALGAGCRRQAEPAPGPWPPIVSPEADQAAPELSAEASRRTIVVPPGYHVELVAKEPLVQDPILIDFDADGRLWVVEMPAFAAGGWMHDRDGDLKMDDKTLVSDTFGRRDANPEHNANSLVWGMDNWVHTSEHD